MQSNKRLRNIYNCMMTRCYNPKTAVYQRYGARGITVCDEWYGDYTAFAEWALANGYRDDLTIDRKDTYGPYSPENCRWATKKQQGNNRRDNHRISFLGETKTVTEFAEELGMEPATLGMRLYRGWSIQRALTTPVKTHERKRKIVV